MTQYANPMLSFITSERMEKQNVAEQGKRKTKQMIMEMQPHMKKEEEDKAIKLACNVLKIKLPKLVITKAAALTSNFGTNLKVKSIDVRYRLSQNFLTLRSFYLSWLELS